MADNDDNLIVMMLASAAGFRGYPLRVCLLVVDDTDGVDEKTCC